MQQASVVEEQSTETFDLVKYLLLFWHWLWVILLALIIAVIGAYYVSKMIRPVYQAKTTVLVDMASSNSANSDYGFVLLNSQLTQTYSQMITKAPILTEVATNLGIAPIDPKSVSAKPIVNTQLISLTVNSTDPQKAANIANEIFEVFSKHISSLQTSRYTASEQSLQTQMSDIEKKLSDANDQLSSTTDAAEKYRLESMIANYSQTYSSLLQSFEQVRLAEAQTLSSIVQIEPAIPPIDPISPKVLMNIALAGMLSIFLSCGVIVGFDLLNDKIKTPEEIGSKLGLPVLGIISHHKTNGKPITDVQPLSPISEAFRTLRTNVQFAGASFDKPMSTMMITSAMPSEGKTEVLINLGIVLSQMKQRVLLIDADLRRSSLHHRLGLDNMIGLSRIFINPELGVGFALQPTMFNGLAVITAGDPPPNPSELLGSQIMSTILDDLKNMFDIILIDTPPALVVTDAAVLLPNVDGVLLVIKPGMTSITALTRLVNQFRQLNANFLGVVVNDINLKNSSYGYYYKHYQYKSDYSANNGHKKIKLNFPIIRNSKKMIKENQGNKYP